MAFSSIPGYFDASNWHQNHQIIGEGSANNHLHQPAAQPPPPPPPLPHGGAIRPRSMAEKARMENIQMPEAALKCPRCESTNTKFCYYNNYSHTQPRHFCKNCRRYWTKGGALRNVPVGGCRRRNKPSKSRSSMSPASTDRQTNTSSISTTSTTNSGSGIIGLTSQLTQLRFMSPLSQLSDTLTGDMALNYTGISAPVVGVSNEMSFHGMSNVLGSTGEVASLLSNGNGSHDSWRLNQPLSFLGGLEMPPNPGMFRFHGGEPTFMGLETYADQVRPRLSTLNPQNLAVKLEDNHPKLNLSRQIISGIQGNDHWNPNPTWNELSGFSSSSTNNPL